MRLMIAFVLTLLPFSACFAQNSFSLTTLTGLNFSFTTAASLETNSVKTNALRVNINPKSQSISVYVRISNYSTPAAYDGGDMALQVDYKSVNSSTNVYNLVTAPLTLGISDQRLFSINRRNYNYQFYYDMICTAPNYNTETGHYNFTLTFTMTQP